MNDSKYVNITVAGMMSFCFMVGMAVADFSQSAGLGFWFRLNCLMVFGAAWYVVAVTHGKRKARKEAAK